MQKIEYLESRDAPFHPMPNLDYTKHKMLKFSEKNNPKSSQLEAEVLRLDSKTQNQQNTKLVISVLSKWKTFCAASFFKVV